MTDKIRYYKRFRTEEIFLWNDFEGCYVRSEPSVGYFAKWPGQSTEFQVDATSEMVQMAIEGMTEVSREDYERAITRPRNIVG